jgi:hypothetical protein
MKWSKRTSKNKTSNAIDITASHVSDIVMISIPKKYKKILIGFVLFAK